MNLQNPNFPQNYLQSQLLVEAKHELINGQVYEMAETNDDHNLIALNVASELRNQLKNTPYRTFMADMKVKADQDFYYPDVMVVGQQDNGSNDYKTAPIIIAEVLSKLTRRFDQTDKRFRYQQISSLEEYVLIEQDKGEIQVFSKQNHWRSSYYYLGDEVIFSALDVALRVEDIYYQVNNEDVLEFLGRKGA